MNGIGEMGTLLFWVGLMAVLSLMDALARRKREGQKPDPGDATEPPVADRGRRDQPTSVEDGSDWAYLGGSSEEASPDSSSQVERPIPGKGWDVPESPTPGRRIEAAESPSPGEAVRETQPALTATAEEIREKGRRELLASSSRLAVAESVPVVAGPGPVGHRGPSGSRHEDPSDRLRALFRGDPWALRTAVLYREVLGPPVGSRSAPGGWEERD